jgi:glycosyltransferase involved in cell wall biosynthesis
MKAKFFNVKICYFGAYRHDYPRNQILRMGLAQHGVQVLECQVPVQWRTWQRASILLKKFLPIAKSVDVILLAEFCQSLGWLATTLSRLYKKPLISDMLVSLYDSAVFVRNTARADSGTAQRLFRMESSLIAQSAAVLVDSPAHAEFFTAEMSANPNKLHVIPLGVNDTHFRAQAKAEKPGGNLLVQYYGSYNPAHGVAEMVKAAHRLSDLPHLQFQMIGKGQDRPLAEKLAKEYQLKNLRFLEPVPYADLPALAAQADIALGEFATTSQSNRCVANKVYQNMAIGNCLINGDTPAIRAMYTPWQHLAVCPLGDAPALADTIRQLAENPSLRRSLAQAGQAHTLANYTPRPLGARLKDIIQKTLSEQ